MAKTTKPDVRFIVDTKPSTISANSLDLSVSIVVVDSEGKIRNPSFGWSDDTGTGQYEDLTITAYCDRKDDGFWYGTEPVTYNGARVDLRRAESMVKTLRRLDKEMNRLQTTWGRPTDFAAFMAQLAQAMGCIDPNPFGRKVAGNGWSYDNNEYRWMNVDTLRFHLNTTVAEWKGEG